MTVQAIAATNSAMRADRRRRAVSASPSWTALARALLLLALLFAAASALAHKDHRKAAVNAVSETSLAAPATETSAPRSPSPVTGESAAPGGDDRAAPATRLLDWLGRLHPIVVHFPIAFFPAALFTAIVGRSRPAFVEPVRFLILAGGITAPIAALLGWLDAGPGWTSDEALLGAHRWLGSFIGLLALGLALFAYRHPGRDRGTAMIAGLSVITLAIAVQGWLGGALVHGMDHLNW